MPDYLLARHQQTKQEQEWKRKHLPSTSEPAPEPEDVSWLPVIVTVLVVGGTLAAWN